MRGIGLLKNLQKRGLVLLVFAVAVFFCAAAPAWAQGGDDNSSPQAIEKRLQELRVLYKDDHPEIQRYLRALEKARENEARRQTEKMMKQRQESAPASAK
ncbi:MAG: hypothetical protein K9K65_10250 [Desulfarculaceae bacterium]|nr:hypothetical protein [Desulfarculaceae bacterium]MCF8048493.1 hypothetical protein [Desulfarculaceae bacterium]MCF8066937.1 hypothetical protein [Desulfarculaceae bacterium]MCF8098211.1 hypothetical protein [Desulfarculaceae bacterium]MCF8123561.1 hypothetical protein [Desulfarculaceae bacterium]